MLDVLLIEDPPSLLVVLIQRDDDYVVDDLAVNDHSLTNALTNELSALQILPVDEVHQHHEGVVPAHGTVVPENVLPQMVHDWLILGVRRNELVDRAVVPQKIVVNVLVGITCFTDWRFAGFLSTVRLQCICGIRRHKRRKRRGDSWGEQGTPIRIKRRAMKRTEDRMKTVLPQIASDLREPHAHEDRGDEEAPEESTEE